MLRGLSEDRQTNIKQPDQSCINSVTSQQHPLLRFLLRFCQTRYRKVIELSKWGKRMNEINGGGNLVGHSGCKSLKPKLKPEGKPEKPSRPDFGDRVELGGHQHNLLWRPGMNTGERVKLPWTENDNGNHQIRPMASLQAFQMSRPAAHGLDITA